MDIHDDDNFSALSHIGNMFKDTPDEVPAPKPNVELEVAELEKLFKL